MVFNIQFDIPLMMKVFMQKVLIFLHHHQFQKLFNVVLNSHLLLKHEVKIKIMDQEDKVMDIQEDKVDNKDILVVDQVHKVVVLVDHHTKVQILIKQVAMVDTNINFL